MNKRKLIACIVGLLATAGLLRAEATPLILTNHLGYEPLLAKQAVIRGRAGEQFSIFTVKTWPGEQTVCQGPVVAMGPVVKWRDWHFFSLDFSELQNEGEYIIECPAGNRSLRSFPFRIQKNILERHSISDVLYYFKGQRCSGLLDKADRQITFLGRPGTVDVHGGWYDATGDYGKHLSHLSFSTYFNPQQTPLVVYSLLRTLELLESRADDDFTQFKRRLLDEAAYGADFLLRMKNPQGSFYQTVSGRGPGKKPEDRRITPASKAFSIKVSKPREADFKQNADPEDGGDIYEVSLRSGGGMAIAALAMAGRLPAGGDFSTADYIKTAEDAFAYLQAHNLELVNDGRENIVDDYCALLAASELLRTTKKEIYAREAKRRAENLINRLVVSGPYRNYWRADDRDRPFFHAADAGLPLVSLLAYHDLAEQKLQARIVAAVRQSLEFELAVTAEVNNPFNLARQYVQNKEGKRRTTFFYPHDSETMPWWQGENARLASLAAAARLALPFFNSDPVFQKKLQIYALGQLNWILGLNPFDACMLQGSGRNNPEYMFFGSYQYHNAPGGICNGITAGLKDEADIDFNLLYETTGLDYDWRWGEQWLPHGSWYLLAVAAGKAEVPAAAPQTRKAVIAYLFPEDNLLQPGSVAVEKLTHLNYAFADIKDGRVVEGFKHDAENLEFLNRQKVRNPRLKILISVGGWTWSGNFSDMALTHQSRRRFIASALAFIKRHGLDGIDIDWEYPGLEGYGNRHRGEDKQNFTVLLKELRQELDRAGKKANQHFLLTIAAGAMDEFLANTEMEKAQQYLDFVNLMAYDQFEADVDNITGHHAPLFVNPKNPKGIAAAIMVDHFCAAGVPASKLILGVPFYGRAWGDVPETEHGLYQPGQPPKEHLNTSFKNIKTNLENNEDFTRYWDDSAQAPFLYNPLQRLFVTYEDEESVAAKCRYVKQKNLAGVMFWEYEGDFENRLLDAINRELAVK